MTTRPEQLKQVQQEAFELFHRKNADYGDAFAKYGPIGVLVRLGDKIQRLQHITKMDIALVKSETLRDTLIDLHNYAAMAIMLLDESPDQVVLTDDDSESDHRIGTPPESLEHEYMTEHPYMYPQENGGRCTIS